MKMKFTNSSIEKLKPRAKAYRVSDEGQPGLVVSVSPAGNKSYLLRYRFQGKQSSTKIGSPSEVSVSQARDLVRDKLHQLRLGVDPVEAKREAAAERKRRKTSTIGAYLYGPFKAAADERRSGRGDEAVRTIERDFGDWLDLPLSDITPDMVKVWRKQQLKTRESSTVRRKETELRSLFAAAVNNGVIDKHPLQQLKTLPDGDPRRRYLTDDEEARLRKALLARDRSKLKASRLLDESEPFYDYLTPAVLFTLNTGLRQKEMLLLDWSDFTSDWAFAHLRSETTKSGKPRTIPLNDEAREVMQQWRTMHPNATAVFTHSDQRLTRFKKAFSGVVEKAEVIDFTWHCLRHSFASSLVRRGVPLLEVSKLLGHANSAITEKHYAHLSPDNLTAAVSVLNKIT